jgi:membrane protease YdiL (CAAX protease family)
LVLAEWWATWSPLLLTSDLQTTLFIVVGGFGPLVAAALDTWTVGDSVRGWAGQLLRWTVSPRYWAFALLFPAVAIVAASLAHTVVFDGQFDPASTSTLVRSPALFVQVFLFGGGSEELGWRGFALLRLQRSYSALVASLVIGVGWFAWHLALFLVAGSAQAAVPVHYYLLQGENLAVYGGRESDNPCLYIAWGCITHRPRRYIRPHAGTIGQYRDSDRTHRWYPAERMSRIPTQNNEITPNPPQDRSNGGVALPARVGVQTRGSQTNRLRCGGKPRRLRRGGCHRLSVGEPSRRCWSRSATCAGTVTPQYVHAHDRPATPERRSRSSRAPREAPQPSQR